MATIDEVRAFAEREVFQKLVANATPFATLAELLAFVQGLNAQERAQVLADANKRDSVFNQIRGRQLRVQAQSAVAVDLGAEPYEISEALMDQIIE